MDSIFSAIVGDYRQFQARQKNRPFLEAAMAACALAATADGEISFAERIRVDQILDTLDRLKVFDPHEGVDLFNGYCKTIFDSPKNGRTRAHRIVQRVTSDEETTRLLVRLCMAVANTGTHPRLAPQIEAVMLCSSLGLKPEQVGIEVPKDLLKL